MSRRIILALMIAVLGLVSAIARAADQPATTGSSTDQSVTDKMKDTATTATEKAREAATTAKDKLKDAATTTTKKAKDTATSATEKTQETAKRAGKELSDSLITLKTKLALLADEKVNSTDISVTTKAGVITLRGNVATDEAKQAAEADAMKVKGAKRVVNHLVVAPKADEKAVERKDDEIVKDIEGRLKQDPNLKKMSIHVYSNKGIVTLTGDVPSFKTSLRASEKARQVAGVRAVRNELNIRTNRT